MRTPGNDTEWAIGPNRFLDLPERDLPLALGFEFQEPRRGIAGSGSSVARTDLGTTGQVLVRPLSRGRRGRWVGESWARFEQHSVAGADPIQVNAINRLWRLYAVTNPDRHGVTKIRLSGIDDTALWPALGAIVDAGVPLVDAESGAPVVLESEPARADVVTKEQTAGTEGDLHVTADFTHPALTQATECVRIGRPVHGIAWNAAGTIHVARLRAPASPQWLKLSSYPQGMLVPAGERSVFDRDVLPLLLQEGWAVPSPAATLRDISDYREATDAIIEVGGRTEGPSQDWFDLDISLKVGSHRVTMPELLGALSRGDEAIFLPTGEYVRLNTPEIERLRQLLIEARGLTDARRTGIRVPRVRQSWWEDLLALGVVETATNAWLDSVREAISSPPEPAPVPHGLTATLRPYQKEGFEWLANLRRSGLGGVLADDMGLGKTVQTLAMIQDEREQNAGQRGKSGPWLVVAPTSVVSNWAAEARKFTPGLRVAIVESTAKRRQASLAELARSTDILVTSYTLLRLESAEYANLRPCGVILDEAQQTKNPASQTFTSIIRLGAPVTYAITGTPMENNLGELWSVFALTAPGLLGSMPQFRKSTRKPIERGEPDAGMRMALLRRRIAPFLLRRTKEQVAADLPEKQEQVLGVELSEEHRRIYDRHLARVRQRVLHLAEDMDHNRVHVLAALTRLRQLAIDPALVDDPADSGDQTPASKDLHSGDFNARDLHSKDFHSKTDALIPLLHEVAGEGHRVLVFSQFTRYLRMIADRLTKEGIAYSYLDGATTHRSAVIAEFAEGDAPVFLISLKAGGVGLNLTMADYVVLTDPWWNPAVEAQAVDRTQRIGQTRPVHVYRIVSVGTIEEKVLALQESKRALVADVLSGDDDGAESMVGIAGESGVTGRGGAVGGAKLTLEDLHILLS